jgi:rhomboid protease GluP
MALWANVVVFAAGLALARSPRALLRVPTRVLYELGMSDALAVFRELRIETLVTSCFVHASVLHLLCNLYVLAEVGPPVERALGTARMTVLWLVCGVSGSLASATVGFLAETERTSEGVSGALSGVLGAALVFGFRTGGKESLLGRSMVKWLGLLVVIQVAAVVLGVADRFDNAAHTGAFVVGAALGAAWGERPVTVRDSGVRARVGAVLLVVACFVVASMRERRDPFSTLGATERCDLASFLVRSGQCDPAWAALLAAKRLLPDQPSVMAIESEWRRVCVASGG